MKRIGLTLIAYAVIAVTTCAQRAASIKINEVMTNNSQSIQDEFGNTGAWLEIANTSYSTYDIRGMYITTNPIVLDKTMSASERMKQMSIIPNEDNRTRLSARQHIVFFLNSNPTKGTLHFATKADNTKPVWIGLYDGNAVDLIDSVTVPVLQANTSYARKSDGAPIWVTKSVEAVTPGIDNFIKTDMTKSERLKHDDPYGIGITVLCMGIVFCSLALLYIFFLIFGYIADQRSKLHKVATTQPIKPIVSTSKKINEVRHKTTNILKDGFETKGRDKEVYIAVIAMALKQYTDDVHDVESGILTIKPHQSNWGEHIYFSDTTKRF